MEVLLKSGKDFFLPILQLLSVYKGSGIYGSSVVGTLLLYSKADGSTSYKHKVQTLRWDRELLQLSLRLVRGQPQEQS